MSKEENKLALKIMEDLYKEFEIFKDKKQYIKMVNIISDDVAEYVVSKELKNE